MRVIGRDRASRGNRILEAKRREVSLLERKARRLNKESMDAFSKQRGYKDISSMKGFRGEGGSAIEKGLEKKGYRKSEEISGEFGNVGKMELAKVVKESRMLDIKKGILERKIKRLKEAVDKREFIQERRKKGLRRVSKMEDRKTTFESRRARLRMLEAKRKAKEECFECEDKEKGSMKEANERLFNISKQLREARLNIIRQSLREEKEGKDKEDVETGKEDLEEAKKKSGKKEYEKEEKKLEEGKKKEKEGKKEEKKEDKKLKESEQKEGNLLNESAFASSKQARKVRLQRALDGLI